MNIQITAYGLGSGHDEAAGGSYDDTDLRKQIAAVAESVRKIADVPKKDFGNELNSNGFVTVKFKKPFSKIPFVKATVDLKTRSAQSINITNVTETSFEILDSSWDFDDMSGVWYEAHLID